MNCKGPQPRERLIPGAEFTINGPIPSRPFTFTARPLLWENCQARGKLFLVLFFFFHYKSFFLCFFFSTFLKLARLLRQCSGFNDLA
jgi:hypothetical protein